MPWRHSVTLWHDHIWKYKINDIFEFGNPEYYWNKKRIISLARLQAEIGTACLMTSWRHFVTLFIHANMTTIIKLSSATKEITETKIKLALLHICRLRWRQFVYWCHVVNFMTSWRHVMTWRHHANTYTMIACNPSIEISTEIHVYHHFRTSTSWYKRNEFCDVMTSRHDVMTSCKHKNDNIFRLGEPENYRNKKRIISLALLQAEIEYRLFLTSWHDVMTWRHHENTKLTTFSNSATQSFIETKKESSF